MQLNCWKQCQTVLKQLTNKIFIDMISFSYTCLFVTSFSKINRGHGNQKPLLQDKTGYTEKRWERLRPRQQGNG